MTAFQLNLFPDQPPTPIQPRKRQRSQPQPVVIQSCTTEQAAILLGVSVSTLYRARQTGQPYRKDGRIAQAMGINSWRVTIPQSSH